MTVQPTYKFYHWSPSLPSLVSSIFRPHRFSLLFIVPSHLRLSLPLSLFCPSNLHLSHLSNNTSSHLSAARNHHHQSSLCPIYLAASFTAALAPLIFHCDMVFPAILCTGQFFIEQLSCIEVCQLSHLHSCAPVRVTMCWSQSTCYHNV